MKFSAFLSVTPCMAACLNLKLIFMRKSHKWGAIMLCQFSVKNYKSFQDEVTIDFQAANITEHEDSVIIDKRDGEKYLPLAAIYGPNGGGKSNIINAFYDLIYKVMSPICAAYNNKNCISLTNNKRVITPFKFNPSSITQPTEFELFFRTGKGEYRYNLSVKNEKVIFESLSIRNLHNKKITEVFTRSNDKNRLNELLLQGVKGSGITDTLPFLSYLGIAYKGIDIVNDIFHWIEDDVEIVNYSNTFIERTINVFDSQENKELILEMMKEMDIDIDDYRMEKLPNNDYQIYTKHIVDGFENELNLSEESSGTVKLFGLLPDIAKSIINGRTLFIDELDSKVHPKLLEYIIDLYRDPNKNKNGAQLVFTSQDLMTMTSELFRRDEIWFVAKNSQQSSQVYSLVEFKKENGRKPRKDEKYGKQYLEGRYGADPYLRRMIDWDDYCE